VQPAVSLATAFVESTINHVVSKRFVQKQQMQWTPQVWDFELTSIDNSAAHVKP
jgi:hypothetical protein